MYLKICVNSNIFDRRCEITGQEIQGARKDCSKNHPEFREQRRNIGRQYCECIHKALGKDGNCNHQGGRGHRENGGGNPGGS